MSKKYVPPSKRNNVSPVKSEFVMKEDEFPLLSNSGLRRRDIPTKSFAVLAAEWDDKTKEEKELAEHRQSLARQEQERISRERMNIVKHTRTEDQENIYNDEDEESPLTVENDGWSTVNHVKAKRELTVEEKYIRDNQRMEEEMRMQEENTVWREDADWDYRDRRTQN
jgi:hypothetical protein